MPLNYIGNILQAGRGTSIGENELFSCPGELCNENFQYHEINAIGYSTGYDSYGEWIFGDIYGKGVSL